MFRSLLHRHRYRDRLERIVVLVASNGRDLVDHLHPAEDFSEDAVSSIQPAIVGQTDEELRAVIVEIARTRTVTRGFGHGNGSPLMGSVAQLRVQPIAGTSGSVSEPVRFFAQRITALNDKTWDDTVKGRAIVELHLDEVDEVLDVTRCGFGIEANLDLAELGRDRHTRVDFLEFHRHGVSM